MSRRILLFDSDAPRLAMLAETVQRLEAEPVLLSGVPAAQAVRGAAAIVATSDEGLDLLARVALDHPGLPRVAVLDRPAGVEELLALIDRVHPFAIVPAPLIAERMVPLLQELLLQVVDGFTTELTRRTLLPQPADFGRLVSDRLTGLACWHYLRLRLDEELERASRYARPVSVALIDVDDLRGLNDRHGRAAGDFALRQLGAMFALGARSVDFVGRWAGGTFALVLPETTAGAAFGLAERLRADIAARRFAQSAEESGGRARAPFRLTVSAGVASTVREGASRPAGLLARADAALQRAKNGGRNRSVRDG